MKFHDISLKIADISIRMELEQPVELEESFAPFVCEDDASQFHAVFRCVPELPEIPETIIHEDLCYRVHSNGKGGYVRSFFDAPRDMTAYAVADYDYPNGQIRVDYLEKGKHCVCEMTNSFFHLGIEAIMLQKQRFFLHASCIRTHLGGILFSGPSGIGKSTQARLWCDHRGSKLINGDRTIISREKGSYLAWGSPYAGSSRCYVNESVPVTAIIMLQQGKSCELRRLGVGEAFRKLYSGMTAYSWDRSSMETACDLVYDLARQIPVYEFTCTADESAVAYLEKALQGVSNL